MAGHDSNSLCRLIIFVVAVVFYSAIQNGDADRTSRRTSVGSGSFYTAHAFVPPPTFPSKNPFDCKGLISQLEIFKANKMSSAAWKTHNIWGMYYPRKTHHVLAATTTGDVDKTDTENKPILVNINQMKTEESIGISDLEVGFDSIVNKRYACTRFKRYNESAATEVPQASISDLSVVKKAYKCLELSQRAPTGFNAQPYKVILVHSKEDKERLSKFCIGRNAYRVRDSDCTAVFLADKECGRDGNRFVNFLVDNMDPPSNDDERETITKTKTSRTRRPLSSNELLKLRLLIMLFSSGYPIPWLLNVPFSWAVRTAMFTLSFFARCLQSMRCRFRILSKLFPTDIQMLPTLSSADTWAQKNTMLVAMTYMLACTSRGLATCPMEGIDATGVRKVLDIPGRYSIPLIVSTGTPYRRSQNEALETDDVGLSHGDDGGFSPRYKLNEVMFGNVFGMPCDLA
jgi:nitroreductase